MTRPPRLTAWLLAGLFPLALSAGCSNPVARWLPTSEPASPATPAAATTATVPGEIQRLPEGAAASAATGRFVSYPRPAGTEKPAWGRSLIGTPTYGAGLSPQANKSSCFS